MNTLSVSLVVLVSGFFAIIGLVVLVKNPREGANVTFAGLTAGLMIFILANFFSSYIDVSYALANALSGLTAVAGAFVMYMLLLFSLYFQNPKTKFWSFPVVLVSLMAMLTCIVSPTQLVLTSVYPQGNLWVVSWGPYAGVFLIYMLVYFFASVFVLHRAYRESSGIARLRTQYILLSLFISIGISIVTNLAVPLLAGDFSLSPYGPFVTVFIIIGFSYAIIRHRLFDIRLIVARSVAYILLLATLACIYIAAIFSTTELLFRNNAPTTAQNFAYVILAIILAFTFQPLRRFFERLTDSVFYRDRYDIEQVLSSIGKLMVSEIVLDALLKDVLTQLCSNLRVETGQFMIFDDSKIFKIEHFGRLPSRLMVAPTALKLRRELYISDELETGAVKEVMETHGIRVSLPLRRGRTFIGFLILGDKLSGDIYDSQDIKLLEILSSELALAISNAKAYEEIGQFTATLQKRVHEATAELKDANEDLTALDKSKDEFISMASHQLRTPLTAIKGYLSMLIEGDAGNVRGEQKEFLEYAYDGTERMVGLIADLLNVSRLSAGRFVVDDQPTDLASIVASEVTRLRSHAESKHLNLHLVPLHGQLPELEVDSDKTRQVVVNFIENAIYYTNKGSIYVSADCDDERLYFRVRDTGIGVPKAAQKRLFKKFYRAKNAQAVRADGTGLGLYLAQKVIESEGGTIIFESAEGKGSTFGFTLPLKHHVPAKAPDKPKIINVKATA